MVRPVLLLATLLIAASMVAGNKPPDPHYLAKRTSAIAHQSAFVHGYLHGYEEGFHLADLDIQMGRAARDIRKSKEARDAAGYRHEFGDKRFFTCGYHEGLRVGYGDGIAGRAFRAINELQGIGVTPQAGGGRADPAFDQGFSQGYASGQQQGLQDGRLEATSNPPPATCPAAPATMRQTFCTAYVDGYRVGYSDGFTNVARPVVAQAAAGGGDK